MSFTLLTLAQLHYLSLLISVPLLTLSTITSSSADFLPVSVLSGTSLNWISSYLTNRTQSVKICNACSSPSTITSGVPQGSVLGPILFALYTSPVSAIAEAHGVSQQQYADDTQLYISISSKKNLFKHCPA